MNVLSLFDGISCGQVALERTNIRVDKYFSSEIDSHTIKIAQKNYPDTIQMGDVKQVRSKNLPKIDLLIGGSPCQGFSFSGKQLNFKDPRSKLFFEFVRLLKECKPRYFLLENVRMKKEFKDVISKQLGVQPIEINSALVSAQQRKRLYWTNIQGITQPEDKKIYLKDIIQKGLPFTDKAYCLKIGGNQGLTLKGVEDYLNKKRGNFILKEKPVRIGHFNSGGQGDRVYSIKGKSVCLSALGGGRGAKTGLYAIAQRGRNIINNKRKNIKGSKTKQRLETSYSEKGNCLTSVQKDSLLLDSTNIPALVRKLTSIECERLQTLPDDYTKGISDTQRIKSLGNGWTVEVIAHIFKNIKNNKK